MKARLGIGGYEFTPRRIGGMLMGIVILSAGIALFKQSILGNDSISALNMRLADILGIGLGAEQLLSNLVLLAVQFLFGRSYIGLGTLFNGACVGYMVAFIYDLLRTLAGAPGSFPEQLLWMLAGVLVVSFGCALYQTADMGVAPYDYLALGLRDHLHLPYFGCRMFCDLLCAAVCYMLGGLVGLGTVICALGLGPFVQYFTRHAAEPWIRGRKEKSDNG